jgi:hypothetical protein
MATKPSMKFIATTSDKLNDIAVKSGQLIFCTDKRAIYLDTDSRHSFQTIINVYDDATRRAIEHPLEGYYYTRMENVLWSYFGEWVQITGQDSSLVFADGNLPQEGVENKLYVDNENIYRWNSTNQEYYSMAGGSTWENYSAE